MRALNSLIALTLLVALPAAAQQRGEHLTYRIQHQLWGDIGTLTEDILSDGEVTKVTAGIDVHVAVFGITLHEVHGQWEEVWRDGCLQKFDATTIADTETEIIVGRRTDSMFVIRSGETRSEAPPDVQPVNPWSLQFVHASTLMSPETGRVFSAVVDDKGSAAVRLGGRVASLHHYVVKANGAHHLYFDPAGRLVRTEFADLTGHVSITLVPPEEITLAAAR